MTGSERYRKRRYKNVLRTCPRCGHKPHVPGDCKARYRVTFKPGEPGDPCLCEMQPGEKQ